MLLNKNEHNTVILTFLYKTSAGRAGAVSLQWAWSASSNSEW